MFILVSQNPASKTQGQYILTVHSHSFSNLPNKLIIFLVYVAQYKTIQTLNSR